MFAGEQMKTTRGEEAACKWSNLKFGAYTLKLLNVSRVKGRTERWPEIVMLQVPGAAKKKLQGRNILRDLLNEHEVFSKPARELKQSVTLRGKGTTWHVIVVHGKTSTITLVWVPIVQ
jgi:hypothetical protein